MLFTFPSRYWYAIGLLRVFSLGGWARRIHTGFHVSRATQDSAKLRLASNTGLSPSMVKFSNLFFSQKFMLHRSPTTPQMPKHLRFGLFPVRSPLLGESFLFSFPTGTKMFQFPALASYLIGWQSFRLPGCPIRKSMDQRIFAPPHSLSQLITSFIACKSLGIHRTPLNTFYQNTANSNQQRWIYLKLVLYLTLNRHQSIQVCLPYLF